MARLIHQPSQTVLAESLLISHSFIKRCKGLLGYSQLKTNQAMWIQPCSHIHTFFMKFAIDVLFVNKHLHIQCFYKNVPPYKILKGFGKVLSPLQWLIHPSTYQVRSYFQIHSVFEFQAGQLNTHFLHKGDSVYVDS